MNLLCGVQGDRGQAKERGRPCRWRFFPPLSFHSQIEKRAPQAAEGWPRSLQSVGLRWAACSGTMNLEPPRKEVGSSVQTFLGHLDFTSSVSLSP